MAGWLRVTAIPNEPDVPRAKFLLSLDHVWGFNAIPGEPVQIWFSADPAERALSIVESMEDVEVQLGLALPGVPARAAEPFPGMHRGFDWATGGSG